MKENEKVVLIKGGTEDYHRVHIYVIKEENDND